MDQCRKDSVIKPIDDCNQELTSINDWNRRKFHWSNVYVANYGLKATDIRHHGVHQNNCLIEAKKYSYSNKHVTDIGCDCSANDQCLRELRPKQQTQTFSH